MQVQEQHSRIATKAVSLVGDVPDLVIVPHQSIRTLPRQFVSSKQPVHQDKCTVFSGDASYLKENLDIILLPEFREVVFVLDRGEPQVYELVEAVRETGRLVRIVLADVFV